MNKCKHIDFTLSQVENYTLWLNCNDCDYYGETSLSLIPRTRIEWNKPDYLIKCPKCGCEEGLKNG